jgi:signal peptidase I
MNTSPEDIQCTIEKVELKSKPVLRLFGALLSTVVPGSGQWLLGDTKRGLKFFLAFVLLFILYWPIRLPLHYRGLILVVFYAITLAIVSSCFALTARLEKALPMSTWWMLVVVPMAVIFAIALETNIFLHVAGFRVFNIPSTSMAPTLKEGDTIVADMRHFGHERPKEGDIVIFKHKGIYLVKRIAAIGGEQISSLDGNINVNGTNVNEPYAHHEGGASPEMNDFAAKIIPADELFVMGDNRDLSLDSRMGEFGKVFSTDVAGTPLYIMSSKWDRSGSKIQ